MKRILALFLTALFVLTSCKGKSETTNSQHTTETVFIEQTLQALQTEAFTPEEDVQTDDGYVQDEQTSDGYVQDEQTTDGYVQDEQTTDGYVQEEQTYPVTDAETVGDDEQVFETDPYVGVNKTEFYANYKPAVSASDAYYRTQHFLMSGSIESQDQMPTIALDRPTENGMYIRNTGGKYSDDGKTYYVVDSNGKIVNRIFKDGAYVTLEEVAAYIFAFGEIPANYVSQKGGNPTTNPWGKYLRVNHSRFFGDTDKYPYEPELPEISGCGGEIDYFELDIGTTGTDCDPVYKPYEYNNGTKITRGAARIVYTRYDANGDKIIDINEKYLFYTNNHYNDFREYLNYQGGWGEIFGNITGGGKISNKNDCNPTPYVETARKDLTAA